MSQVNKSKIIRTIKDFILIIVTILIVFFIKEHILHLNKENVEDEVTRLKQDISELKNNLELQIRYIDWYKCMDSSKTDRECFICDSLYNPNQDFIY